MVDSNGRALGIIPRPLVHKLNLLHRGAGIVVSRTVPILDGGGSSGDDAATAAATAMPDLYCHRRTDTKRIFPSLYDMFVGGVSTAGEDARWTAASEVAEELGLARGLSILEEEGMEDSLMADSPGPLSEELFKCTVCTPYNRCVVSVFSYGFDPEKETARWQEKEVSWGGFVPYRTVVDAAERSVGRLRERDEWPGGYDWPGGNEVRGAERKRESEGGDFGSGTEWTEWDFVPDGLLVWEAWLRWMDGEDSRMVQGMN